jgi:integrase
MSSLFQRGGVWQVAFLLGARRVYRSTRIKVKEDPRGLLAKKVQARIDLDQAKTHAGLQDVPADLAALIRQAVASKRTTAPVWARVVGFILPRWERFLASRGVRIAEDIHPRHIEEWISERRAAGKSDSTIERDIMILQAVIVEANKGRRVNRISTDDWPRIRQRLAARPDRIGAYTMDEAGRILEWVRATTHKGDWYLPLLFLTLTGARYGEMARVRVGDFAGGFVRLETHKTARTTSEQFRTIDLHPRLVVELLPTFEGRPPGELAFPGRAGRQFSAIDIVSRACAALGIQYRRVHAFRHGWITALIAAGVPVPVVQKMAGHRSIITTMRYCHVSGADQGYAGRIKL